ncbi:MAG: 4Fe-4S binding protein [Endomicrobiales bacterium]|nr:4Fe-4S binding protein [Endomicrobiales bacterium]
MKKLFIDIEKCYQCKECTAECSYYYHPQKKQGYVRCLALAAQEHVCRRCDDPPCVKGCPQEALEKRPDGMLDRHSMRCTSCKTCTIACPFGVIYPEIVEYKTTMCDYCTDRADDTVPPVCTVTCPMGALKWIEVEENPAKDIYAVRDGKYYVRVIKWKK